MLTFTFYLNEKMLKDHVKTDPQYLEKKLEEYRAKKRRKESINKAKEYIKSFFDGLFKTNPRHNIIQQEIASPQPVLKKKVVPKQMIPEDVALLSDDEVEETEDDPPLCQCSYIKMLYYALCFLLWLTLYIIFIKLQFGAVYFVLSALVAMYFNTRTGPKGQNEVSAYSVFNKDCESIPGTLKAEQFEREIRYGAGAVH